MTVYVRIKKLNGRQGHAELGTWLNQSGVGEVDYFEGGWVDSIMPVVAPHLKFDIEEDAMAYVLAHGGEISNTLPVLKKDAEEQEWN
jgi:hypothetical protein